jgi:hypothetical protein
LTLSILSKLKPAVMAEAIVAMIGAITVTVGGTPQMGNANRPTNRLSKRFYTRGSQKIAFGNAGDG